MIITGHTIQDFGEGFWKKNRLQSGKEIDQLRGQNIPHNSKIIDRTAELDCIVSHKSTDLRLKSYASLKMVYRLGMKFVRELSEYKGEVRQDHKIQATYHLTWAIESENCKRVLEWFIPDCELPDIQCSALDSVVNDGLACGVIVKLFKVKDY